MFCHGLFLVNNTIQNLFSCSPEENQRVKCCNQFSVGCCVSASWLDQRLTTMTIIWLVTLSSGQVVCCWHDCVGCYHRNKVWYLQISMTTSSKPRAWVDGRTTRFVCWSSFIPVVSMVNILSSGCDVFVVYDWCCRLCGWQLLCLCVFCVWYSLQEEEGCEGANTEVIILSNFSITDILGTNCPH